MLLTLSLIILVGFLFAEFFIWLKMPKIIGMILAGIILGPFVFNLMSEDMLNISTELRQIALVVILLRAGLSLDLKDLKKIGRPAIFMSFIPATLEIIGVIILAPLFLGFTYLEAALLATILAAVSPAVVVPKTIQLLQEGQGTKKRIPQLIMAGASVDDIFVIVLFTSFVQMAQTKQVSLKALYELPISILLGIGVGILFGLLFTYFFKKYHMRDTNKVLLLLSFALFFLTIEHQFSSLIPYSGLLSTLAMGITLLTKYPILTERLVKKYEKIWVFSEMLLFVLVGAAVNITIIPNIGFTSILIIFLALVGRSIGVWISTMKTDLNFKERLYVVESYLPKATVQASIGGIPLAMGILNGDTMLTIAVLAILTTAPIGAFLMDHTKDKFLGPKTN